MTQSLQEVINRLYKRMKWAVNKLRDLRITKLRRLLEKEDEKLEIRCKSYIYKMIRASLEAYTLSVLAVEGFLPRYGVFEGGIRSHLNRNTAKDMSELELSRATSMDVREFIPDEYVINTEKGIIKNSSHTKDINKGYENENTTGIIGVPICDTTITLVSRITDEEVNRFQLPVVVLGYLKKPHRGIKTYKLQNGREIKRKDGKAIIITKTS